MPYSAAWDLQTAGLNGIPASQRAAESNLEALTIFPLGLKKEKTSGWLHIISITSGNPSDEHYSDDFILQMLFSR